MVKRAESILGEHIISTYHGNEWGKKYVNDIIFEYGSLDKFFNRSFDIKNMPDRKLKQIDIVKKHAGQKPIIEMGFGKADLSMYFARNGYDSYGIDIDTTMFNLAFASLIAWNEPNCNNWPKLDLQSLWRTKYPNKAFSLAYSNGVIEHYQDNEIVQAIKEQLRIADKMMFGVPTKWYEKFPHKRLKDDARFLEKDKWREIIGKSGAKIIEEVDLGHTPEIQKIQSTLPIEERQESFIGYVLEN